MKVVRKIGFGGLELSSIFTAWMDRRSDLERYLPQRPASIDEVVAYVREHGDARRGTAERDAVKAAIEASLGAEMHDAQRAALDALDDPNTLAIVTGQQPCLFGGPLYVVHKVATAIHLARELRRAAPELRIVTVFWNHDEDHDWGEANHVSFVNPSLDVQRVRLRLPSTGCALGRVEVAEAMDRAVDEARDLVVQTPPGLEELEQFRPRSDRETVAQSTTRMLSRHFGEDGLLVLEPTRLPASTRACVRDWHEQAEALRAGTKNDAAELADRGYDVTVDPEQAFVFAIDADGRRKAVPDGEALPSHASASPGVLLRSVWQDSILPTLAYVAGPGEVSYLALADSMYERLGIARPLLVPRASIVHAEPRTRELLDRFDLELQNLRDGASALENEISNRMGEDAKDPADSAEECEERLREIGRRFRAELRDFEEEIARVDAHLVHPLHKIASKTSAELDRFAEKVKRQRRTRAGRYRQHARRLCAELFPRGSLQERVLPLLPFVARGGARFARDVIEVANPFADGPVLTEFESCT